MKAPLTEDPILEREKLLAARGWESDRERTGVLRELLDRSVQRIFLWGYSRLRSRDKAVELTRGALLWASRTLGEVPDGRLLDHWIFEYLATESVARLPLRRSELGPEPCQVLGDDPNEHYLEAYPTCTELRSAFLAYRAMPADALLVRRSGWDVVKPDLDRFLLGHFGEEQAQTSEARDPLRHRLRRIGFRQAFNFLAVLGLVVWVLVLRHENGELRRVLETGGLASSAISDTDGTSTEGGNPDTDGVDLPVPAAVRHLAVETREDLLNFSWDPAEGADSYRLILLSSKMDTLWVRTGIRAARATVRPSEVPALESLGSYVFKVEGFRGARLVAASGMATYPPI